MTSHNVDQGVQKKSPIAVLKELAEKAQTRATDFEDIAEQAMWNRKHPTMQNEWVTVRVRGADAAERLFSALAALGDREGGADG